MSHESGVSSNNMLTNSGNNGAREAVLASIRQSLAASGPFDSAHRAHHSHAELLHTGSRPSVSSQQLIDNFKANLELVGGNCTIVASETEAANKVAEIISETGSKRIAVSDSDVIKRLVSTFEVTENTPQDELFDFDIGITGAQWGIAETGTLLLESSKESHRLTSLVPPVHLCILRAENIRQTLGEILELTSSDLSPAMTFITGASRTSDIELTLAIGVHGPGEVYVIVIADQ